MSILDAGAVTRHVRAAVRTVGLRGDGNFDVSTIGLNTDLEALGVDSLVVGELHSRLTRAYGLPIDPASYKSLTTPTLIADHLIELRLDAEAVTRHVRAAVRTIGLRGDGNFDVSTIALDTDLEALGVDSLIVGELHSRLTRTYGLPIDPASYKSLTTPAMIANHLLELRARTDPTSGAPLVLDPLESDATSTSKAPPAASKTYTEALWDNGLDGVADEAYRRWSSWIR